MRCSIFKPVFIVGALITSLCVGVTTTSAKDRIEEKTYTINTKVAPVKAGDNGAVTLVIKGANGYKWNDKFPAAVRVDGVGKNTHIRFEKSAFAADDFKIADKLKSAGVKIPFKAVSSGRQTITAKARFSVCNKEACIVKNESVEFTVSVK